MKGKWKLVKSCLASVLCVCLIASCMGNMTVAFAGKWDEVPAGKTVNYVSLGDYMTNGMGLPGYKNGGYMEVAPDAYPAQVAEHYGWSLTQLATSGMRAEDLHYILTYGKEGGYPGDAWMEYELLNTGRWPNVDEVAATFQTAVAEADVISAAIGNANFSVFLPAYLTAIMDGEDNGVDFSFATKENGLAGLDPEILDLVTEINDGVMEYLATAMPEETAQKLSDAIIFTTASFMRNYNRALDRIVEMNPDVEIIIHGLINTESGFEIDIVHDGEEIHISMADLRELIVQPINTYLTGWATVKQGMAGYEQATIYYAEAEQVQTLATTFMEVYKSNESAIRERFVADVVKTVFPVVEMDLVDITLADVKAYEAAFEAGISALAAYEQQSAGKAMSAAVYLALEGTILNALDKKVVLDLEEMESISGEVLGMESFAALMSTITDELQNAVFANAMGKMDQVEAELPGADMDTVAKIALLYVTTESVQAAFESNAVITALLSIYGHTSLASCVPTQPDAEGHDQLTDAIIEAYTGEHTPTDEVVNKVFETLQMLKELRDAPMGPGKHGDYVLYEDSYYVAIDELYAGDYGYADKVAAELGIPYAKITEVDEEEVAKADLITVRYNNEPMIGQMIQDAKNYKKVQPKDWTAYVGEEGAAFVQNTLAEVEATLAEMNLGTMKDMAMTAVESYAYECTGQLIGYLKDLKAIAAINPEALILSVSMNNSLEDVVLVMGEQELALGKYIGYVVEAANMEAYAYVLMNENTVYVPANEVATDYNAAANAEAMDFILSLIDEEDRAVLKANAEGNEYIKTQILNALTVSVYEPEEEEPVAPVMKGDLDKNGVVDIDDVLLCLDLCFTTPTAEDYAVADLDANGVIDIDDVLLCLDLCF